MSEEPKVTAQIPAEWTIWVKQLIPLLIAVLSGLTGSHYIGAGSRQDAANWDTQVWRDQYKANAEMLAALKRIEERPAVKP